jgi:hypothetical protein
VWLTVIDLKWPPMELLLEAIDCKLPLMWSSYWLSLLWTEQLMRWDAMIWEAMTDQVLYLLTPY